jgi:hypothetical protein
MKNRKNLYNIIAGLSLQVVAIISGFIVPKIIITNFGSNINGLISSITEFLSYIILLESGFGPVIKSLLYKPIAKNNKNDISRILKSSEKFFKKIAIVFICYILLLCFLYPILVNQEFDFVFTASLIIISAISIFAEYFFGMTFRLFLQADQKSYVISIIQIITYILNLIVLIILVIAKQPIIMIKIASALIFTIRPLLQNYYVRKKYNFNLANEYNDYIITQKWDGLAQHIASVVHGNTDVTILTIFTTLSEVSVYSIYYLITKAIKQIIQAFSSSIDAFWGDLIAKDKNRELNKKFDIYEGLYLFLINILFSSLIILITPFVALYMKGVSDANYFRPLFGYLLSISQFIWAIRLPYNSIILSAGHFKQTRNGAWLEAILNIIISLILVNVLGMIGVVIGTIIAMFVRTSELIYYANKHILRRSPVISVKKIIFMIISSIISVLIINFIIPASPSFFHWVINSMLTILLTFIVNVVLNIIVIYRNKTQIIAIIKKVLKRS